MFLSKLFLKIMSAVLIFNNSFDTILLQFLVFRLVIVTLKVG